MEAIVMIVARRLFDALDQSHIALAGKDLKLRAGLRGEGA
jgi:hypothetical protein